MATKKTTRKRPPEVINPATGNPMRAEAAKYVVQLRTVRRGARNALRSGHPGRRADARQALRNIPAMIRKVYIDEVGR